MSKILEVIKKLENIDSPINKNVIQHQNTFCGKIKKNSFKDFLTPNYRLERQISHDSKKVPMKIKNPNNSFSKRNSFYLSTPRRNKYNYDDIINFNFGSKKTAQLKCINTSSLASNSSEKKNKKSKAKKHSLFNKKNNKELVTNYTQENKKSENIEKKNKKNANLSERKSIYNRNGILHLPLLSKIIPKTKNKYKKQPYKKYYYIDPKMEKLFRQKEYDKINKIFDKDNEEINERLKEKYALLDEKIKKYKLKRPNEETEEGVELLFKKYNDRRAKKFDIVTNRTLEINQNEIDFINIHTLEEIENYNKNKLNNILLDVKGNTRYLIKIGEDNKKGQSRLNDYELTSLANQTNSKVEKLFPDLCAFYLPKILRKNKEYTVKLLYDVFIEFKTLLKCGMIHNRCLNLHKKGIDFETF